VERDTNLRSSTEVRTEQPPRTEACAGCEPIGVPRRGDSESEWVAAARTGDLLAFERLVARHWASVVRVAQRVLLDYHLAQDVAQEAMLRCYQRLNRLDPTRPFLPWARKIARNIAVDRIRRQRLAMTEVLELEPVDLTTCVRETLGTRADPPDGARVWRAIDELPGDERRLLYLRYGRGLSIDLIARECGRSSAMVKLLLHKGRIRLADSLIPLAQQGLRNAKPPHLRARKRGGSRSISANQGFAKYG